MKKGGWLAPKTMCLARKHRDLIHRNQSGIKWIEQAKTACWPNKHVGFNCKIVSIWELEQNSSWVVIIEILGFYHLVYWSLSVYKPLWELKSEPTSRTGPQELLEIARMLILSTATVDFGHQDSRCSWGLHLTTNEHVFLMVFPHRDCLISSQNVKLIHPCAFFFRTVSSLLNWIRKKIFGAQQN